MLSDAAAGWLYRRPFSADAVVNLSALTNAHCRTVNARQFGTSLANREMPPDQGQREQAQTGHEHEVEARRQRRMGECDQALVPQWREAPEERDGDVVADVHARAARARRKDLRH
jgi:hypothetical protein